MSHEPLIAIIDDGEGMRTALDGLMRSVGRSLTFASAEAFLDSVAASASAVVVSDVRMPGGMDGLALLTLVASSSRVPVIIISAVPDPALRERAEAAGAYVFLSKPFDAEVLIDHINKALLAEGR